MKKPEKSWSRNIKKLALAISLMGASIWTITARTALFERPAQAWNETPNRWEVHEWGTFTSMQGTDGKLLAGMHHEEERLPNFVHNRVKQGMTAYKGLRREMPPAGVTQKLETPVIYFYTDRPRKIKVKVDFPKGVISEWYPDAVRFAPPLAFNSRAFWKPKGGSMTWEGTVKPGPAKFPRIAGISIWMPSRQVPDATPFHTVSKRFGQLREQAERFIFYRGVGRFNAWMKVTSTPKNAAVWRLTNQSKQAIPGGIVMRVTRDGGSWHAFGPISAGATMNVKAPGLPIHQGIFLTQVKQRLVDMLVTSGLTKAESWSMVQTWHKSYFQSIGTRVLYIVPRAWTDALLPIQITPTPKKLVRTLVGRIEVLTNAEEMELVRRVTFAYKNQINYRELHTGRWKNQRIFHHLGRLAEPKIRRACALLTETKIKEYCRLVVKQAR